jgi:hypothetical protein
MKIGNSAREQVARNIYDNVNEIVFRTLHTNICDVNDKLLNITWDFMDSSIAQLKDDINTYYAIR